MTWRGTETVSAETSLAFAARAATLATMKQSLDHLPGGKRRELEFVVGAIRDGFAKAVAHRTQPRFRSGKLLKIVLFGSHARGIGWTTRWGATILITICSRWSIMRI
jgi:hypothetical protein